MTKLKAGTKTTIDPSGQKWTPFEICEAIPISDAEICAAGAALGMSEDEARREDQRRRERCTLVKNNRYQVAIDWLPAPNKAWPEIIHLSIRRLDRKPIHDWRDLQRIKNEITHPECEAVELYPAESRIVDVANQFHLWVFSQPGVKFPLGFDSGRHIGSADIGKAKQRPMEA